MSDRTVGVIDVAPGLQIRMTLTTERGNPVVDVRQWDRFAGVWMPGKRGLPIPVEHREAFAMLAGEAAALAVPS